MGRLVRRMVWSSSVSFRRDRNGSVVHLHLRRILYRMDSRCVCISFSSRSNNEWSQWSDVCGEAAEARKRRALNGELTPVHINPKAKTGTFAGSDGGQYRTTLSGCTCPDFQKRKVPCKHMYYLAIKCNIEI